MERFSRHPQCPKCGNLLIKLGYNNDEKGDWIDCTCAMCSYAWKMKPWKADTNAEPAEKIEEGQDVIQRGKDL